MQILDFSFSEFVTTCLTAHPVDTLGYIIALASITWSTWSRVLIGLSVYKPL